MVKYHVRYGISHQYIGSDDELTMVSCHLGAGSSLCAIKNDKSYDISMGFTPLSGVQMTTRSGDVDVSVISYVMRKLQIDDIDKMIYILNKKIWI